MFDFFLDLIEYSFLLHLGLIVNLILIEFLWSFSCRFGNILHRVSSNQICGKIGRYGLNGET